jgi:hypothetical protein
MNAVRKPANLPWGNWRLNLHFLEPAWNLRTREIAMAMLNPEHPAVVAAGLHLGDPADPRTVCGLGYRMQALAIWAKDNGLPAALSDGNVTTSRRSSATAAARTAPHRSLTTYGSSGSCTSSPRYLPAAG